VGLALEERTTDAPENPDDTYYDEVRPDNAEHIQNRVEPKVEGRPEERFERRGCYWEHNQQESMSG